MMEDTRFIKYTIMYSNWATFQLKVMKSEWYNFFLRISQPFLFCFIPLYFIVSSFCALITKMSARGCCKQLVGSVS